MTETISRQSATDATRRLLMLLGMALAFGSSPSMANGPEEFVADPALQNDFTASLPEFGQTDTGVRYAIIQGLAILQGDMILGAVDASGSLIGKSPLRQASERYPLTFNRIRGLGTNSGFTRWPDGIVPYQLDEQLGQQQRDKVHDAIAHWMSRSTIRFIARTDENSQLYPNYLRFEDSYSCASWVGMQGGEQPVMVSNACPLGSVIHEIGHALGLFHEHTRPDRDQFITVLDENVVESKQLNFDVLTAGVDTFSEYDYGSIMHYGQYFFSSNQQPTILVPDGIEIGQRVALSDADARSVDLMYATDIALAPPEARLTDQGMEFTITVENRGALGANELALEMSLPEGSRWTAISANSQWECSTSSAAVLQCQRDTLIEQQSSQFLVLAEASEADVGALELRLDARTLDLDRGNNRYVDGQLQTLPESDGPARDEPAIAAANNSASPDASDLDESLPTPAGTTGGGGGALSWILMLMLASRLTRSGHRS